MKLKILLFVVFAAGVGASYALADGGKHKDKNGCQNVHLRGTIAPQTLTMTVDKAGENSQIAAGSQVALALGATGQVVRVNVEACSTGTGTALQYSVRGLELRVVKPESTVTTSTETTGTTTGKHGDGEHGDQGEHHKGGTTTTPTTTAATTTVATTTAATTTTAPTTTAATTTSH
jgi:hypothetical protein